MARYVDLVGGRYLEPYEQKVWSSSQVIGWRSVQRRNIAILEAIRSGARFIITVDDDNRPLDRTYLFKMVGRFTRRHEVMTVRSPSGWFDPCTRLKPSVHHRGYPYTQRMHHPQPRGDWTSRIMQEEIAVVAGLWKGDPDTDATDKLSNPVKIYGDEMAHPIVLERGTWAPFNSQNTAWRAEYASLMMCWPGVGRFDDIWASYLARRALDHFDLLVEYVAPTVAQARNPHDLFHDLRGELYGYENTDRLCDALRSCPLNSDVTTIDQARMSLYDAVRDVVPPQTLDAFDAWDDDMKRVNKERER